MSTTTSCKQKPQDLSVLILHHPLNPLSLSLHHLLTKASLSPPSPSLSRPPSNPTTSTFVPRNMAKKQATGITLVDSVCLKTVKTGSQNLSTGLKIVSNSKGGGRQANIMAKVPGLEKTYAASIDNLQSLIDVYKMMPGTRLGLIIAVPPTVSSDAVSINTLDWGIFQHKDEAPPSPPRDGVSDDSQLLQSPPVSDRGTADAASKTYDHQLGARLQPEPSGGTPSLPPKGQDGALHTSPSFDPWTQSPTREDQPGAEAQETLEDDISGMESLKVDSDEIDLLA
ncbi:hypothetical protein F66182_491 [Fusarium sp. NRRL 66182]|nr:hypothetical protein F66182_491 [Fusarium sp. NRRL 66182]